MHIDRYLWILHISRGDIVTDVMNLWVVNGLYKTLVWSGEYFLADWIAVPLRVPNPLHARIPWLIRFDLAQAIELVRKSNLHIHVRPCDFVAQVVIGTGNKPLRLLGLRYPDEQERAYRGDHDGHGCPPALHVSYPLCVVTYPP
jgi:hypothetical protein